MSLILFTTRADRALKRFIKAAQEESVPFRYLLYRNLKVKNQDIINLESSVITIKPKDKIILRDPYNTEEDFSQMLKIILKKHPDNILLDRKCYTQFPNYEDKLFQTKFFRKIRISFPQTWTGTEWQQISDFPIIVKRRIGSRGRGIRIIGSKSKLKKFFASHNPQDYIIQKYTRAINEFRMIVLKEKILGIVDKKIHLKKHGKIGVTTNKQIDHLPESVEKQTLQIVKKLGADFAGIDIVLGEDNKYYFLEVNLSPQFGGFTNATGINVAQKIVKLYKL